MLLLITISILFGILQPAYPVTAEGKHEDVAYVDKREELKKRSGLTDEEVQKYLNKGYQLDDIIEAYNQSNLAKSDIETTLKQVKPTIKNTSKEAKSSTVDNTNGQIYSITASSTSTGSTEALNNVNIRPYEAPFSIDLDNETLSTLSGNLSLQYVDATLPGRNGMSFTLLRTYNSQSAQYYDMDVDPYSGNTTKQSHQDKMYPIGKGWSWSLSSIKIENSKKYLQLAGVGSYEIDSNNTIKGYPWKDLSFSEDTSVIVNGVTSAYLVRSINGRNQYFSSDGLLIEISDAYANTIQFHYSALQEYGKVLTGIYDSLGNSLIISYTPSQVTVQKGDETVTYIKTKKNGVELLSQVWDPIGRATTYDYALSPAKFNLLGSTPQMENPYALLLGVMHPTGVKTEYEYETSPVTRYIAADAVNQVYRIKSRKEKIQYETGIQTTHNYKIIEYTGDIGSSYGVDMVGSSALTANLKEYLTLPDGNQQLLTETILTNEKDYIDVDTPEIYYNTEVKNVSGLEDHVTTYLYDRARRSSYVPTTISTQYINNGVAQDPLTTSRTYDDYGNLLAETLPGNIRTEYSYDSSTHLLTSVTAPVTDQLNKYTEYVRNQNGSIVQVKVFENNTNGTVLQQVNYEDIDAYGNFETIQIQDDSRVIKVGFDYNATTNFGFPSSQSLLVTDVDNATTSFNRTYEYNLTDGNLLTYTDGNGNITSYEYDPIGRVNKVIHPLDEGELVPASAKIYYDDFNNILRTIDETGITSVVKFNPLGLKVNEGLEEAGVYKSKTKYAYDSIGRMIETEDALGNITTYTYDNWGRQVRVDYADNSYATTTYDDIERTKVSTDPEGEAYKETYDFLGQVVKWEELTSTSNMIRHYTYDKAGNQRSLVEGDQTSLYTYDGLSRLVSVENAKHEVTRYSYSKNGKLLTTTYPDNKIKQNKHDELGRLIQTTDANGKIEKFYYDNNNNQTKMIDRNGKSFTYKYSKRNMQLEKKAPDEIISFEYDLAGRRISMKDGSSPNPTIYQYNQYSGALDKVIYPDQKFISYHYDENGNRTVMRDPFGANLVYTYDSRNRLSGIGPTVGEYEAEYEYYSNNLLKSVVQRNNVSSQYTYDGLRLDTLTHTSPNQTIFNSYSYEYDIHGNINSQVESGETYNYTYDSLNRIETSSKNNETYGYDSRGNRQLLESSRQMNSRQFSYTYDDRDRLTSTVVDGKTVSYKYNGDGLLVERTENGETTRYYYDGNQIIAEAIVVNGIAEFKARYIRGLALVAREDSGFDKSYYLHNGHGDVVELRDITGQTTLNQYRYDIWGTPILQKETVENPFLYSGEYWDDTTDLQYLRARWYDPVLGRFTTEDTYEGELNNPLSLNLYTYVHNNPLIYSDPSGNVKIRVDELLFLKEMGIELKDYKSGKEKGKLTYARKADKRDLKKHERYVVDLLLDMGKDVYLNPEAKGESKQYDFLVNGFYKVELKTANPENGEFKLTSAYDAIVYGIVEQKAQVVIYDLTYHNVDYDVMDIYDLDEKLREKFNQTDYRYDVQVWTDDGIYYFDWQDPGATGRYGGKII